MSSSIAFDKFYNIVDGQQRSADAYRHGVNPATKAKLWDVCHRLSTEPVGRR